MPRKWQNSAKKRHILRFMWWWNAFCHKNLDIFFRGKREFSAGFLIFAGKSLKRFERFKDLGSPQVPRKRSCVGLLALPAMWRFSSHSGERVRQSIPNNPQQRKRNSNTQLTAKSKNERMKSKPAEWLPRKLVRKTEFPCLTRDIESDSKKSKRQTASRTKLRVHKKRFYWHNANPLKSTTAAKPPLARDARCLNFRPTRVESR